MPRNPEKPFLRKITSSNDIQSVEASDVAFVVNLGSVTFDQSFGMRGESDLRLATQIRRLCDVLTAVADKLEQVHDDLNVGSEIDSEDYTPSEYQEILEEWYSTAKELTADHFAELSTVLEEFETSVNL